LHTTHSKYNMRSVEQSQFFIIRCSIQLSIDMASANTEISRLLNSRCDILIATPGRLLDHLSSSGGALASKFSGLKTIVYDEADRLLDQGFKPALDAILRFLPPKTTRQSLLFSATVSKEIQAVVHNALRPGYEFISTLTDEEQNTHQHGMFEIYYTHGIYSSRHRS